MILVTGAGGKTGRAILNALHAHGVPTRALLRTAQDTSANEIVVGDLAIADTIATAVHGIDALYLMLPNMYAQEQHAAAAWLQAAKAAGVRRIIYHSVLFPQIEAMPHHWQKLRVEEALIRSGLDFTILQPASYMQNILPYITSMREHGEYRVPYSPTAAFSPVDLEDVAAVAARALLEPGHTGAVYQLAGPDVLNSTEMAQQTAQQLGRQVTAVQQSLADWQAANAHLPTYTRDTLAAMFAYYDVHGFAASSFTLAHLLEREATHFAAFLAREANAG